MYYIPKRILSIIRVLPIVVCRVSGKTRRSCSIAYVKALYLCHKVILNCSTSPKSNLIGYIWIRKERERERNCHVLEYSFNFHEGVHHHYYTERLLLSVYKPKCRRGPRVRIRSAFLIRLSDKNKRYIYNFK